MAGYEFRRCVLCGKKINPTDGAATKVSIYDTDAFIKHFGAKPVRTEADFCGWCNYIWQDWRGSDEETQKMLTAFVREIPDYDKTWRGVIEKKDMLVYFMNIQRRFRELEEYTPNDVDICVRKVFDTGYKCEYAKGKRNTKKCESCLRGWLMSEGTYNREGMQTMP